MSGNRKGLMIIISGPSGSGKSTVKDELMAMSDNFYFSVSATTRPKKVNEIDGVDYHYLTQEEFQRLVDNDEFVEYKIYGGSGKSYGTLKSEVMENLDNGKDVILDVEVQGALDIIEKYPDAVSIWVLPPDYSSLSDRLYKRERDTAEEIERRLAIAKEEIEHFHRYDYIVVNEDGKAAEAAKTIMNIVTCEKLKTKHNNDFYKNFNK